MKQTGTRGYEETGTRTNSLNTFSLHHNMHSMYARAHTHASLHACTRTVHMQHASMSIPWDVSGSASGANQTHTP